MKKLLFSFAIIAAFMVANVKAQYTLTVNNNTCSSIFTKLLTTTGGFCNEAMSLTGSFEEITTAEGSQELSPISGEEIVGVAFFDDISGTNELARVFECSPGQTSDSFDMTCGESSSVDVDYSTLINDTQNGVVDVDISL